MTSVQPGSGFILGNNTYDVLRNLSQYVLPGLGTLYFTLSGIWGLPYGEQVVGTAAAIGIFIGVVMGLSKHTYDKNEMAYDGAFVVDSDSETMRMVVDKSVGEVAAKKQLTLKVDNLPGSLPGIDLSSSEGDSQK